jgi:Uma2 family endonuclease
MQDARITAPPPVPRRFRRWTYADLEAMPESLQRIEIIDGDLVMSPSAHALHHQTVVSNFHDLLRAYVRSRRLGLVLTAPCDVVLTERRVVQPDVLFVRKDRIGIVEKAVFGAPDLVVEVLSPGNARLDRTKKFKFYEEAGVPECWIVDPKKSAVEVFALEPDGYTLHDTAAQGGTAHSRLLPGFAVEVDPLFDPLA